MFRFFILSFFVLNIHISFATTKVDNPIKEVQPQEVVQNLDKAESKIKSFVTPIYQKIEVFRKKQAEHFTKVRDGAKERLGVNDTKDVVEDLRPFFAPPTAPSPIPGVDVEKQDLEPAKVDNPMDYAIFLASTAMISFFANVFVFYTLVCLVIFLIFRTLFKSFL